MGYKIFANLTIGIDDLTSKQKLKVKNFIEDEYNATPIPGISNQWLFPIDACFYNAREKVQIALSQLALLLNLERLVFTVNFSSEMWKSHTLTVQIFEPQEES